MRKGLVYAGLFILSCLGTVCLGTGTCFAAEYLLDQSYLSSDSEADSTSNWDYIPEDMTFEEWQDWEPEPEDIRRASDSEASPSSASYDGPSGRSSYPDVYDGSISTTQLSYFGGLVKRFPSDMHYVLFRQDRYLYRLVYSEDMTYSSGMFTASLDVKYVLYNTEYNTVSSGSEGNFRLTPLSYPVYTDIEGPYPILEGNRVYEQKTILFVLVFGWLTNFLLGFFRTGRFRW